MFWSMRRAASELPSSTLFCVSPESSTILAPPSDLIPPEPLISSTASRMPFSASAASNASGPVTGKM